MKKVRESHGKSRVKVRLTEMGEWAYVQSEKRNSLVRILSVLSPEELNQLRSSLEKIRDEVLKEFEKDQKWPEIRIPPSQWKNSEICRKTLGDKKEINPEVKTANTASKRGRPKININA